MSATGQADKLLYTVAESAQRLGVSTKWLYERTRINAIPFRRLGKLVRFTDADLQAIINGQHEKREVA